MRITAKGQITIPDEIREKLGWTSDSEVVLEVEGNTVRIRRAAPQTEGRPPGRRSLKNESFVGMWRDREDMADSAEWVRRARREEWSRR